MTTAVLRVGAATSTTVRALHGVNNGPVTYGGLVDVSELYRDAGVPSVRLHDPNWPHAWEVDIHTIFPDFTKDPSREESYEFARTDDYISSVVATGAKVVYRLGESIEHTPRKYYVHPPQDPVKWAQICIGIIRHYNEGWANGFFHTIEHWEIWNEADNPDKGVMWSGSDDEYFDLYAAAARAIKAEFPDLKVGGPACTMINESHTREFLRRCREDNVPLDFFSWHTYADSVDAIMRNAAIVDGWMTEYGFEDVQIHLNEWNYIAAVDTDRPAVETRRFLFTGLKGEAGASFSAGVLCALQDTRVSVANYYDGQPRGWYCGLFDDYGAPLPGYHVFRHFGSMTGLPRVDASFDGWTQGLYALAVLRDDRLEIVMVNPTAERRRSEITGVDPDATLIATGVWDPERTHALESPVIDLPPHSVTVIREQTPADVSH